MADNTGIFTQYYINYNYGGILQAFSLQRFINNNIGECEQVRIEDIYNVGIANYLKSSKRIKLKLFFNSVIVTVKKIVKFILFPNRYIKIQQKRKMIDIFKNEIPHSSMIFSEESITNSLNYTNYICGSDCIWYITDNPYCTALGFVPDSKKKISYAASLGSGSIPDGWSEKYLDFVKRLDAISVREKSIAEELRSLIPEKEIFVAADPTLLFTASDWDSFLYHRNNEKEYALHYILSEDKKQAKDSLEYTLKCSLKSFTFPNVQNCINRKSSWKRDYGDIQNYSADPLDFVEIIKDAEVVITDSFHAVIFSVLFHKPFYALKRETQSEFVGRVENFLEDVGLMSQMITSEELASLNTIPKIDFTYADKVIENNRKASIKYLEDNLK